MTPNNKHYSFLAFWGLFGLLMVLFRVLLTGSFFYVFLVWNLFLASIPYCISQVTTAYFNLVSKKWLLLPVAFIWLLFLPNAPYIITDFIHLNQSSGNLLWYDAFMIFVFATNGLCYGILSMHDVYKLLRTNWNAYFTIYLIILVAFLSGFGIYLGRYLRWNSWEIFTDPVTLLYDIKISLFDAKYRFKSWGITCLFGGLLSFSWLYYKSLITTNKSV